jgi:hypothetical protein
MQEAADSTPGVGVHGVDVRLPPFRPDRPALWFATAEAKFQLTAITSERTKFSHIISQLDRRHAAEVEDVITSPPERGPYKTLKSEPMRRLSTSREQRVRQLLMHEEMGDRKPSQFVRHHKSLAPEVPDDFLRSIRSGRSEGDLHSAPQLEDRICEDAPQPTTACVSPVCEKASLVQRVEELSRQVASLTLNRTRRRWHSRSRRTCGNPPPTEKVLQIQPSASTTDGSETRHRSVHCHAPSAGRKTATADVTGGRRLHYKRRPPLHHRPDRQTPLSARRRVRPMRVPSQACSRAQGTRQL